MERRFAKKTIKSNPKTILQEVLQNKNIPLPVYKLINTYGQEHQLEFLIKLEIYNVGNFFGKALTKKEAETKAADNALNFFNNK